MGQKSPTGPGIVLDRFYINRARLTRLLKDDRLHPSRRMLGTMLAAWMDAYQHPEIQAKLMNILETTFGTPKRMHWVDEDDPVVTEEQQTERLERESAQELKSIFDVALRENSHESVPGNESGGREVRSTVEP